MKVLVTGGQGFIGRFTARELLARGYEVIVFDRVDHRHELKLENAEFMLGDIRDATSVTEAFAHADAFIHLAGVLGTQETIANPNPAAETNILGGLNVFNAAAQYHVPGVNIAVGNYWMNNTYSITKSTMERFVEMYNKERGTSIAIVRALNAYGPEQSVASPYGSSKVRKIMPSFICRALSGQPIEIYGDGTQIMDMVFVADVAKCLVDTMEYTINNGVPSETISCGPGNLTSVSFIAREVIRVVGKGDIVYIPMRPGEPTGSVVLGKPETLEAIGKDRNTYFVPFQVGLNASVEYFRKYLDQNRS